MIFSVYIRSIKGIKGQTTPALVKALHLGTEETIIDIDGTGTTQPVLQHAGVSAWPGERAHVFYYWILSAECRTFILVEKFKFVCKS